MKKRLGRGLEALLGSDSPPIPVAAKSPAQQIAVSKLVAGKFQPRRRFAQAELSTLADSIRQHGILQPILVRASGDKFEIVAGERRWRAAKMAGLPSIPAVVREISDDNARFFSLIENLQRADLNPIEQAAGILQLTEKMQLTHAQAGEKVGLSRPAVSNLLRLLDLAAPVRKLVENGSLDMGKARALLPLPKPSQELLATEIIRHNWTVRQTEAQVRAQLSDKTSKSKKPTADADTRRLEKELSEALSARVEIHHKKTSGKISLHYSSLDILDGILKKLK